MNAGEMVLSALSSLRANLLRSSLTMLGIFIGVASIIAIIAIGRGGQEAIVSTIESQRVQNTIQIIPRELVAPGLPQPGQVLQFSQSDFDLARTFPGVQSVYYTLYGQATMQSASKSVSANVDGGPSYLNEIGHFVVVRGRMYSQSDLIAHRKVALINQSLAIKLFGQQNPLGQIVQLGGMPLQVIGVTQSTQVNFLSGIYGSDTLYMPSTTCTDLFPNWGITEMDVQAQPGVNKTELAKRIVLALNIHAHNAQAFEDSSGFLLGLEHTVGTVTHILTLVIGAIAGIALLVGGIGVMNIMLVSVTERTEEIGIRMSLGATRRAILQQFLVESVTITLIGGGLGIGLGILVAEIVHWVANLPAAISWWAVAGSFVFSGVIGILCGLYPANKAARLNPIDALRYE